MFGTALDVDADVNDKDFVDFLEKNEREELKDKEKKVEGDKKSLKDIYTEGMRNGLMKLETTQQKRVFEKLKTVSVSNLRATFQVFSSLHCLIILSPPLFGIVFDSMERHPEIMNHLHQERQKQTPICSVILSMRAILGEEAVKLLLQEYIATTKRWWNDILDDLNFNLEECHQLRAMYQNVKSFLDKQSTTTRQQLILNISRLPNADKLKIFDSMNMTMKNKSSLFLEKMFQYLADQDKTLLEQIEPGSEINLIAQTRQNVLKKMNVTGIKRPLEWLGDASNKKPRSDENKAPHNEFDNEVKIKSDQGPGPFPW